MDCYQTLNIDENKCLIPCEGIFTDISKERNEDFTENSVGMKNIFNAYEKYKNQFLVDVEYPVSIKGIILTPHTILAR